MKEAHFNGRAREWQESIAPQVIEMRTQHLWFVGWFDWIMTMRIYFDAV